jgi:hypothetical protein
MRVQFEYTIDDVVDLQMRMLKRSRVAKSWASRNLVITSLLTGVIVFAVIPEGLQGRLIMGAIGIVFGALAYLAFNQRSLARRLRKMAEEHIGADDSVVCEVELNNTGIHVRQGETQIIYSWASVNEIEPTSDSVDIYTDKGGLLVVRKRAFRDDSEQQQFIDIANQFATTARAEHTS